MFGLTDWGALVCALTYLVLLSPHLQTPEIYIQITLFVMMVSVADCRAEDTRDGRWQEKGPKGQARGVKAARGGRASAPQLPDPG